MVAATVSERTHKYVCANNARGHTINASPRRMVTLLVVRLLTFAQSIKSSMSVAVIAASARVRSGA